MVECLLHKSEVLGLIPSTEWGVRWGDQWKEINLFGTLYIASFLCNENFLKVNSNARHIALKTITLISKMLCNNK